ncbi:hypothetical protein FOF71_08035 [Lactobacillus paragasseri]|uniref:Uncharacterized protein n=1 Tax=Lactobacillus paragasseri TaxID=2107999 RepID=A0AAW6XQD9_9LACO|nr:hypothetical protein [Lactobacillus paragasseri]MDK6868965.1 hypothetical protein [Lactobacillus paragasseri]TVU99426.1 hypothetical protein FOF71_08035 [Lactobacillus paragasseri]
MVNDDVYVVEIIEQHNIDDPGNWADFDVQTVVFKKLYDARIYLKLVKRTWLEDESIDPKDIYEDLDEIKIKPSKAYRYGFNLQAGIDRRELN